MLSPQDLISSGLPPRPPRRKTTRQYILYRLYAILVIVGWNGTIMGLFAGANEAPETLIPIQQSRSAR